MKFQAELTDLFCGAANYSWCHRAEFTLPDDATDRQVITRAKSELGLTGLRCRRFDYGEVFELRPYGLLQTAFIFPIY